MLKEEKKKTHRSALARTCSKCHVDNEEMKKENNPKIALSEGSVIIYRTLPVELQQMHTSRVNQAVPHMTNFGYE